MRKFLKGQTVVFEPEAILILVSALEDAWASVVASGVPLEGHIDDAREILALRIIETAKNGERNPSRLVGDAVGYLAMKLRTGLKH